MKKAKKENALARLGITSALVLGLSVACIPAAVAYSTEKAGSAASAASDDAAVYEKTEVVYATLAADGAPEGVYVVNQFDVDTAGEVVDYGFYESVSNLTDQAPIGFEDGRASFDVPEGVFYYQGNADASDTALPWKVEVGYFLDGAASPAEDLAGKSGALRVHVKTSPAEGVDPAFAASYMLQITFTLNGDTTRDIEAEGAVIASAGRDRTVAFTVLPGRDADCTLAAQVTDFEMAGIQIAALPYSMAMEMPDTSGMTDQMQALSDAIGQLDEGASSLADGIGLLSAGADELAGGSDEFGAGLARLNANAGSLVAASDEINAALGQVGDALGGIDLSALDKLDLEKLDEIAASLPPLLDELAAALDRLASIVDALPAEYQAAYGKLASALQNLSGELSSLDAGDVAALRAATEGTDAAASAEDLIAVYESARAVAAAYDADAFANVGRGLESLEDIDIADSLERAADLLRSFSADLRELEEQGGISGKVAEIRLLVEGLVELSEEYGSFNSGLADFAAGLDELAGSYDSLNAGVSGTASGLGRLDAGTRELASGVSQLNAATINIPDAMRSEIEALMADYDFPEFEGVSFADSRNENTRAVQFVLTTAAVELPAPEAAEEPEEEEQGVIDRFFALFS